MRIRWLACLLLGVATAAVAEPFRFYAVYDRVAGMVGRGLVHELRGLLDAGYGIDTPGMTGNLGK